MFRSNSMRGCDLFVDAGRSEEFFEGIVPVLGDVGDAKQARSGELVAVLGGNLFVRRPVVIDTASFQYPKPDADRTVLRSVERSRMPEHRAAGLRQSAA
jgi:hypothetical protein